MKLRKAVLVLLVVAATGYWTGTTVANNWWGGNPGYKWGDSSIPVANNAPTNLDGRNYYQAYQEEVWTDGNSWDSSDLTLTSKTCNKQSGCRGMIALYADSYGFNGWAGLASISVRGKTITKGTSKLNNSYLSDTSTYTFDDVKIVACQEVGHDFGLDHDFTGTVTCMNYSWNSSAPSAHNFDMINNVMGY